MLAPLFLAIGLPIEGIGMLIAVDAIPDLFATVLNASGDMAAAALVAGGGRTTAIAEAPHARRGGVQPAADLRV